jgi:hypothetical protein
MTRAKTKRRVATPVRAILRKESALSSKVEDGLGAVKKPHRGLIDETIRADFADSLEIDENLRPGHEEENHWDYLLGHRPSESVIALEPHSPNEKEISVVIAKRTAAKEQLAPHLEEGARIAAWLWVSPGKVGFLSMERAGIRLAQHGIAFVGKKLLPKHLP